MNEQNQRNPFADHRYSQGQQSQRQPANYQKQPVQGPAYDNGYQPQPQYGQPYPQGIPSQYPYPQTMSSAKPKTPWLKLLVAFLLGFMLGAAGSCSTKTDSVSHQEDSETVVKVSDEKTDDKKNEKEGEKTEQAEEQAKEEAEAPAPIENTSEPEQDVPAEWRNALHSAESYSNYMHMSKQAVYDQLTSEYGDKFPPEAAQYAIDNLAADYNANALKSAEGYSEVMHMSKQEIYDQLTSEYGDKFTAEEAQYAIDNLVADYNANALASAKSYQEFMSMSNDAIYDQLTSEYGDKFTPEEAQYAIDHLNE